MIEIQIPRGKYDGKIAKHMASVIHDQKPDPQKDSWHKKKTFHIMTMGNGQ